MIKRVSNADVVRNSVQNFSKCKKPCASPVSSNFNYSKLASEALKLNSLNYARN